MRVFTAVLLAALVAGAVACGGGDSDPRDVGAEAKKPQAQPKPATDPETAGTSTQAEASAVGEGGDANDRKIEISSSDFPSGTWPLTIESGELRCEDTKTARTIIFRANGQDYPVNGVPEGGKIIGIEPIWKKKDDPQSPGTRMDITPLFKKGYELCGD